MRDSTVIVKKGFFTSLVTGVLGFASVLVVCVTALGFYGMRIVDRRASEILNPTLDTVRTVLTNWRTSLPPALSDAINDRRAPEYRDQIHVATRIVNEDDGQRVVLEVENAGPELVSVLAGRLVATSEDGDPVRGDAIYIATPLTIEEPEWRGPLMPQSKRSVIERYWRPRQTISGVQFEITELRVWDKNAKQPAQNPTPTAGTPESAPLASVDR